MRSGYKHKNTDSIVLQSHSYNHKNYHKKKVDNG